MPSDKKVKLFSEMLDNLEFESVEQTPLTLLLAMVAMEIIKKREITPDESLFDARYHDLFDSLDALAICIEDYGPLIQCKTYLSLCKAIKRDIPEPPLYLTDEAKKLCKQFFKNFYHIKHPLKDRL